MAISILIPVYNHDVTALVTVLTGQLAQLGKQAEIILQDDGSESSFDIINSKLAAGFGISYNRNDGNEGRTATRLKLAALAKYDHLLFLDCDSQVVQRNFLEKYFREAESEVDLVSGGRIYFASAPAECNQRLHWKYGVKREGRVVAGDQKRIPGFMSNNFLVKRSVFGNLDFSLPLKGYGHEDTWWGIQFRQAGIKLLRINNPVLHGSLEDATTYLRKSEQALANLVVLEKNTDKELLRKEVRIYRWKRRLRSVGLAGIYAWIESPFHRTFRKNLVSCKPRLLYFDLYRLAALIRLSRRSAPKTSN